MCLSKSVVVSVGYAESAVLLYLLGLLCLFLNRICFVMNPILYFTEFVISKYLSSSNAMEFKKHFCKYCETV